LLGLGSLVVLLPLTALPTYPFHPPTHQSHAATPKDFPLPTLGPILEAVGEDVKHGRGFGVLRGLPVERWTRVQSLVAYWGIGLYWGRMQHQVRLLLACCFD